MKPTVAKFTRDNPCTKLHIWNTFRGRRGFLPVQVTEAQAQIGANAPRVMERKGYLIRERGDRADVYILTPSGEDWLTEGMQRYLKNHPAEEENANHLPRSW